MISHNFSSYFSPENFQCEPQITRLLNSSTAFEWVSYAISAVLLSFFGIREKVKVGRNICGLVNSMKSIISEPKNVSDVMKERLDIELFDRRRIN
jgi:hypothetical protein